MLITDTMQAFISGESERVRNGSATELTSQWQAYEPGRLADTFSLLWLGHQATWADSSDALLTKLIGPQGSLQDCRLERWKLGVGHGGSVGRSFRGAVLIECDLSGLDLRGCNFSHTWLESVDLSGSNLENVNFQECSLLDTDFTGASLRGADFRLSDKGMSLRFSDKRYAEQRARGLLAHNNCKVDEVNKIYIAMANPEYEIARKIARKMIEGGSSQFLGLTQRGPSQKDPGAAQKFVELLVAVGYATYDRAGSARTVDVTAEGRVPLRKLAEETGLDPTLEGYFASRRR